MKYTAEQLTELAEKKPDEFVRMIAEVCYGWTLCKDGYWDLKSDSKIGFYRPLTKTERGRSQAFELAEEFDCWPAKLLNGNWRGLMPDAIYEDLQLAIAIEAVLTAQEMKR